MNYALYRLPYAQTYTEICSERDVKRLASYRDIGAEKGFVVAPFVQSVEAPVVVIHPDNICESIVPSAPTKALSGNPASITQPTASYTEAFSLFHDALTKGSFQKLVLSRSKSVDINISNCKELFFEACRRYPRMMIMLVSTSQTGTWLVSTPEILVTGDGTWFRTMALAGTMPYKEGYQSWSEKNQQEQHFVEKYIEDRLQHFSDEIIKDGPRTQRAGDLVHLCTDFRFHLAEGHTLGDIISQLHPTPAVCGLPKEEALNFILSHENNERSYYSGFMGPVGMNDGSHLFVSLRCAHINDSSAVLYAGGGIMLESSLDTEWEETEQKMQTIAQVLYVL